MVRSMNTMAGFSETGQSKAERSTPLLSFTTKLPYGYCGLTFTMIDTDVVTA
jgi:hypothetical protein